MSTSEDVLAAAHELFELDEERVRCPYPVFAGLHAQSPVMWFDEIESFVITDYDIIVDNFAQSESPGNEQRDFWGSAAADRDGSRNTAGIKNPAVDKLIDKVVFAKDREELLAATHALDRVLLWNFYVVPQWHYPYERIAYWDVFGRPEKLPSQTSALSQIWWFDADKQKAIDAKRGR